jgi:hypothetical protein
MIIFLALLGPVGVPTNNRQILNYPLDLPADCALMCLGVHLNIPGAEGRAAPCVPHGVRVGRTGASHRVSNAAANRRPGAGKATLVVKSLDNTHMLSVSSSPIYDLSRLCRCHGRFHALRWSHTQTTVVSA